MTEVRAPEGLRRIGSGKVRELYEVDDRHLLLVASDRISAFDVVLPDPVPGKGEVLTALTQFWLERLADLVPGHLVGWRAAELPPGARHLAGRAMLVRRLEMFPVECVARGYLAGSGWKEYRAAGTVCGIRLPAGLGEAARLPEPIFTPATKATTGHDENIPEARMAELVGADATRRLRELTLAVYRRGAEHAARCGILLADTKLEFGRAVSGPVGRPGGDSGQPGGRAGGDSGRAGGAADGRAGGEIVLADEVLTPDSSRFWPADAWTPGASPPSFDKQYVRDWLEATGWDKTPPGPRLPADVVAGTAARYREAYERLAGRSLDDWLAEARGRPSRG